MRPDFRTPQRALEPFGSQGRQAQSRYRAFVRAGIGLPDPKAKAIGGIYLGDKGVVRRRQPRLRLSTEVPRRQREPISYALETLLRRRGSDDALALAYHEHGYSLREIALVLGIHHSTVSRRLQAHERAEQSGR